MLDARLFAYACKYKNVNPYVRIRMINYAQLIKDYAQFMCSYA